jgi:4-hydroxybenzoate polyprenyltransferase
MPPFSRDPMTPDTYRPVAATAEPAVETVRRRSPARALIAILRPRQWIKNTVIFAALLFSHTLTDATHLARSVAAFALFCAISSAVYVLNDIMDLESDRAHPTKRLRPLAAGELPAGIAGTVGLALALSGLVFAYQLSPPFAALAAVYLVVNLMYSAWLKQVVIVDVMVISSGFVIRAVSGGVVIGVEVSAWLILCTVLLSLFLAFTKRRQELALLESRAGESRAILREYSVGFLDQMISIVTAGTVVAYFLYTLAPETAAKLGTPWLPLTIPFVLYGIFRYLYLVHQRGMGENPTGALYSDRPLLLNVILWVVTAVVILYLR